MSVFNDEQRKHDEQTISTFLIVFNLTLLGLFVLICVYQAA